MLLTLLAVCGLALAGCLAVLLLGVLPFVRTVDVAERRGFSTFRWGADAIVGIVIMLAFAYCVIARDWSKLLLIPAVGMAWVSLAVVALINPDDHHVGGIAGAHQR
jgi:hypothetical protein